MPRLRPFLDRFLFARALAACAVVLIAGCDGAGPDADDDPAVPERPGWTLVWNDEFDEDGLPDPERWTYDTGDHGWGNNELQNYQSREPETARVEDGHLVITTYLVERPAFKEYRSARLKTQGRAAWKYGRVEVRAKLPGGRGTWPAIWMLPAANTYGGWPRSGEIDIMEHVGMDPGVVHGTVHTDAYNHTRGTQRGAQIRVEDATTAFHVYAVEWYADRIDFFVDGERYFTFAKEDAGPAVWPFDHPFFLLLNTAVGGNWAGQQGVDDSVFPQEMVVDYVRVWEKD